ncbi:MAG: sulfite exporter TauE/SafE family protein [Pseudomonadota bacterium]
MDAFMADLGPITFFVALSIAVLAGVVKGVVGFAMPMVLISGLSTIMQPDVALAALILPTLVTNGMQALRQGMGAAWRSARRFRVYIFVGGAALVLSAQLVAVIPLSLLLGIIGVPVVLFALVQVLGWQLRLRTQTVGTEAGIGALAGFLGGMSGVWGPPTVMYLTALNTPKAEQVRVQGVIYGLGAVLLLGAHIASGVFRADTWPLSAMMVVPAIFGMWIGGRLLDRIDQPLFRKATLLVLLLAGLNLCRRAFLA